MHAGEVHHVTSLGRRTTQSYVVLQTATGCLGFVGLCIPGLLLFTSSICHLIPLALSCVIYFFCNVIHKVQLNARKKVYVVYTVYVICKVIHNTTDFIPRHCIQVSTSAKCIKWNCSCKATQKCFSFLI